MTSAPSGWIDVVVADLLRHGLLCMSEAERLRSEPDPEGDHAIGLLLAAPDLRPRLEAYVVPSCPVPATRDLGWPTVGGRWDSVHINHAAPLFARPARSTRTN